LSVRLDVADAVARPDRAGKPGFPVSLRKWDAFQAQDPQSAAPLVPCVALLRQAADIIRPVAPLMEPPITEAKRRRLNDATSRATVLVTQATRCIDNARPPDVFSANGGPPSRAPGGEAGPDVPRDRSSPGPRGGTSGGSIPAGVADNR